jgi:predicted enzyme related to lactoylglutathione lyase
VEQPKNRVSHVVYCFRAENIDNAAEFLTDVLGAKFEDSSRPELGLRILISLENGLELIAPSPDTGVVGERFVRFLEEHGEGVYNIVYGVEDLDVTTERAERFGVGVTHRSSFAHLPPWQGRFEVLDEAHLEPYLGMKITLGRIEPVSS